jgi:glycosyltransferase involved in cell wall biosynthesis
VENKVPSTGKELVYHAKISKPQNENSSTLRIFAIFFHPNSMVTALGGAEKRFIETQKILCTRKDLDITVLESVPGLLTKAHVDCRKFLVPSTYQGKGWLSTYLGWMLWMVRASIKSIALAGDTKPEIIFVPNSTLPNLISGYITSLVLRLPLCVVTHHIDVPFVDVANSKQLSVYGCYRSIKYGKSVSLAKTLSFYVTFFFLKKAKGIITVSNFTAHVLRNAGISEARILVSGNAVDASLVQNAMHSTSRKTYDGIFVGRIAKEKGVFDLLKVWKEVVKARKNAKLVLVGNGLELSLVKNRIAAYGLGKRVFVQGSCNDEELHSLLNSSRVFIFPSLFEGWGIAVAEALACGLPVVAYDIPALREVFGDCRSVFLVPVKSLEGMTAAVLDLLDASENEFSELRHYSQSYSRQFSWEKVAQKDLELLRTFENGF